MSFLALAVYAGEDVAVASLDDIWGSQLPVDTKPCKEKVEKEPKKPSAMSSGDKDEDHAVERHIKKAAKSVDALYTARANCFAASEKVVATGKLVLAHIQGNGSIMQMTLGKVNKAIGNTLRNSNKTL